MESLAFAQQTDIQFMPRVALNAGAEDDHRQRADHITDAIPSRRDQNRQTDANDRRRIAALEDKISALAKENPRRRKGDISRQTAQQAADKIEPVFAAVRDDPANGSRAIVLAQALNSEFAFMSQGGLLQCFLDRTKVQ